MQMSDLSGCSMTSTSLTGKNLQTSCDPYNQRTHCIAQGESLLPNRHVVGTTQMGPRVAAWSSSSKKEAHVNPQSTSRTPRWYAAAALQEDPPVFPARGHCGPASCGPALQATNSSHWHRDEASGRHNTFSQTRLQLPSKLSSREISLSNQLAASRQEIARLLQEQEDREEAAENTAQHELAAQEQTRKHTKETAATAKLCHQAVARAEEKRKGDADAAAEKQRQAVAEAHRKGRAAVDAQDKLDRAAISRIIGKYERAAIRASTKAVEEEALRVSEHQARMDEVQLEVEEQSRSARDSRRTQQDAHTKELAECKQTGADNTKTCADSHSLALKQLIGRLAADRAAQTSRESAELAALEASARAEVGAAAAKYDTDCRAGKATLERLKQEGQDSGEAIRQKYHRLLDEQIKCHKEAGSSAKDMFASGWAEKVASHQQEKEAQIKTCRGEIMQLLQVKNTDLATYMQAMRHAHLVEIRTGNLMMHNSLEAQPHLNPSQRLHVMQHLYECQAKLEAEINPNAPPSQLLLTHTIQTPPTQVPNVSAHQERSAGKDS